MAVDVADAKPKSTKFIVSPSPWAVTLKKLNGNLNAVWLLQHIKWWVERAGRSGREWADLTRSQWMENTGLTRHQYDAALKALRACHLIEVKHDKAGRQKYLRTFIRLPLPEKADTVGAVTVPAGSDKVSETMSANSDADLQIMSAGSDHMSGNTCLQKKKTQEFSSASAEIKDEKDNKDKKVSGKVNIDQITWNEAMKSEYEAAPVIFTSYHSNHLEKIVKYIRDNVQSVDHSEVIRTLVSLWDKEAGLPNYVGSFGLKFGHRPDLGTVCLFVNHVADWYKLYATETEINREYISSWLTSNGISHDKNASSMALFIQQQREYKEMNTFKWGSNKKVISD